MIENNDRQAIAIPPIYEMRNRFFIVIFSPSLHFMAKTIALRYPHYQCSTFRN